MKISLLKLQTIIAERPKISVTQIQIRILPMREDIKTDEIIIKDDIIEKLQLRR